MKLIAFPECGKIVNTHGVMGAVKIESWCNSPAVLAKLKRVYLPTKQGMKELKINRASVFKQFVIAELEGITTVEEANALRGKVLHAAREDLKIPKGEYLIAELIGLDLVDVATGKVYGQLTEVLDQGPADIYVVNTPSGERMMPAVPEFVKGIDEERGILVAPIGGMLED
ncbi:MAG: 16S rRNA processing protein RimM [Clostridia bacterium]|nr:16S rRNA processing protein RimM [Clostridia bacterium]